MTGKIYIVIPNFTGGWPNTIECLESVCRLDYPNFQIIVVDDCSEDDSLNFIQNWILGKLNRAISQGNPLKLQPLSPEARKKRGILRLDQNFRPEGEKTDGSLILIRSTANRGFAGASNLGLKYALKTNDFDFVWLLNNDTVVDQKALSHLVARMKAKPTAGLCGSTLLFYDFPQRVQTLGGVRYNRLTGLGKPLGFNTSILQNHSIEKIERQLDYIYGSSMLVSKAFLKDIGLMNEEYFIYFEEIDWSCRAKGKYTLAFAPGSLVYHKAGATVGGGYKIGERSSLFSDYYYFKNMIRFTRKFYFWALPSVYLRILGILFQKIVGRQWSCGWLLVQTVLNLRVDTDKLWKRKTCGAE